MKPKLLKTLSVGSLISFIGAYNLKIRICKRYENFSPWAKFDSLTPNIFEFTTLAVWT